MRFKSIALISFLTFYCVIVVFGQVATIRDPNGWTNVRENPDGQSEVKLKVFENEVFWYNLADVESSQEWIEVYIPLNDYCLGESHLQNTVGYIHETKLEPLEKLEPYSGSEFSFSYTIGEFDPSNRNIRTDGAWVSSIDGRWAWGTDGNMPIHQVNAIQVSMLGKEVQVHPVLFSDIFECDNEFSVFRRGDTFFVHQLNSDGSGGYEVVWVFEKNSLKQRLVGTRI